MSYHSERMERAVGYALGRAHDHHDPRTWTVDPEAFGAAYADAWEALDSGASNYIPDLVGAYETFARNGML